MPADAASNTVYARAGIIEETGTAYFDALQLEDGTLPNRYNLIENANLTNGSTTPEFWVNNQYMESSDILTTITDETYPTILGNDKKVLKIDGKPDKKKGLYQKVNVAGNSGDVFVISGWAKAESVFLTQDENVERRFALCVGIERTDGTFQWDFKKFNEDYSQWQYVSGKTIADSDYKSVYYFALYYENENLAYFDGLQLYREEFGQSYAYDGKGNLVSTEDLAKSKSTFEYNSDNELIKLLTPKGGEFTYTYHENNKHNVKTATTAENVTSTFDYDQYGNPERTQVGNTSLFIEASATYSSDGNYVESVEDPSGNTVNYVYNKKRDNVDVVIDSEGNKAFSIYDELDTLVENYAIPANDKVEVFPFRGSTTGSNGTVPTIDESSFNFDGSSEALFREDGKQVTYDLPLTMDEGTVSMYFKPSATGTRYLFANGGSDFEMLNIYVNSNDYLLVAVRGNDNTWTGVGNSTEKVKVDEWNFMSFNWTTTGTELSGDLYLNDNKVSMSVDNFKDFTGVDVTIGSYTNETYGLNGEISQFIFSERRFDDAETNSIKQSGRLNYLKDNYVGNKYIYENDRVKSIIHNEVTYNFTYDSFGNVKEVKVGNQALISHAYEARNGKLISSTYGNGNTVTHDFDEEDRIISDKYDNVKKYEYDGNGNIGRHIDNENDITYRYIYDFADRLGKVVDSEGNITEYNYDIESNLESIVQKINNDTYTTSYSYDLDKKLKDINYGDNKITYGYDATLGRLTSKGISTNGGTSSIYDVTYNYENGQLTNSTTNRISTINNNGDTLNYTYDSRGNIKTVTDKNNKTIEYFYNYLNELIRENNQELDKTITYSYDKGGNILSKKEYAYTISDTPETLIKEYNYQYTDANWKDKLTSFDGKAITYDLIGNPLTYDNYTFTWQKGRQLGAISGNGKNISYKYDASGIRTEKNVDGVITKYQLEGDKVVFESNGTDEIYYTYSSDGKLVSMNLNDIEYFYIRNTQGDIIGLIDVSGTEVVKYTYDSWGKLESTKGSLKDTVGVKNPYRYRGYRYDTETGLYYLQSRYYNPEWGRFINADALAGVVGKILSHNVFAYCENNPINMSDSSGYRPIFSVTGEETNEMYQTSLEVMAKSSISKPKKYQKTNTRKKGFYITKDQVVGIAKGLSGGIVDGFIEKASEKLPSHIIDFGNRASRRAGNYFAIPIPGMETIKTTTVMGVIGLFATGASVVSNFKNYGIGEALGRSAIDIGVTAISIYAGAVGTPAAGMVVGTAAGIGGEVLKNLFWGSK